jgi:hypothetical protein
MTSINQPAAPPRTRLSDAQIRDAVNSAASRIIDKDLENDLSTVGVDALQQARINLAMSQATDSWHAQLKFLRALEQRLLEACNAEPSEKPTSAFRKRKSQMHADLGSVRAARSRHIAEICPTPQPEADEVWAFTLYAIALKHGVPLP